MNAALANCNPFVNLPHVLNDARGELLSAQAELHTLRIKAGLGRIKRNGIMITRAQERVCKSLDALWAAEQNIIS